MIDKRRNPFEINQLQREATEWFARMRGDEAERHRAGFERWLTRGAVHPSAYSRIANLYSDGKRVNSENLPPPQPVRGAAKRVWRNRRAGRICCLADGRRSDPARRQRSQWDAD